MTTTIYRTVKFIYPAQKTLEGGGFPVSRGFPTQQLPLVDPFLLLDQMGPVNWPPQSAIGAPDHPHRGFETVTYLFQGKMVHKDSQGNAQNLNPGDAQWMTAGSGIVHSEMPETEFYHEGGELHGFQVWVNLPKKDKMAKPRYQEIKSDKMPIGYSPNKDATVKVIAGEAMGVKSNIHTHIPISYLHYQLKPGAKIEQAIPEEQNSFAYLISGSGLFGKTKMPAHKEQLALFQNDGDVVIIENPESHDQDLEFLLLSGTPLNEPVARYGPFVMNTEEELQQAFHDFQSGKMGEIQS
ncbi:MAG: redox-sensitive bicupin YhaK (pirin superfamily) [bacterium]|jgi:redox-sensitive bicupin YhaK (pirin superfamily)